MVSIYGESATAKEASSSKEALHRLVRTLSGRSASNDASSSSVPPQPLERTQSSTSASSQKEKVSVGEKLRRFSRELPGKLRKNSKSPAAPPQIHPASPLDSGYGSPTEAASGHAKMLSMVAEVTETDGSLTPDENPSPGTLARRLQDLIDALPFPTFGDPNNRTQPIIKPPKAPARDKSGRPIAPPTPSPIKDTKLIALLSSATFMNGSRQTGDKRRSVWDLLEDLGSPPHGFPESELPPEHEAEPEHEPTESIFPDNSSVMVYSPLVPGSDDHIELADLVPVGVEEQILEDSSSWGSVWPLSILTGTSSIPEAPSTRHEKLSGDIVVSPGVTSIDSAGRKVRIKTVRAWVPSDTKLTFQAMWWGYRLFLPPPVLAILSDKTIEATKRAAMITTALTWFFNNLPIDALPLAVRPAAFLLQRIVPYLGYIGTFISWSWQTIKSYDIGHGVILTATWILPIALIPGTWHEYDYPKTPEPPAPAPLPDIPASPPPTEPPQSPPPDLPPTEPPSTPPTEPPSTPPTLPPLEPPSDSPAPPTGPPTGEPSCPSDGGSPVPDGQKAVKNARFGMPTSPRLLAKRLFSSSSAPNTPGRDKVVDIPVPPAPEELTPIPPVASPRPTSPPLMTPASPVPIGSKLGEELLHGPALGTVPLPDEDGDTPLSTPKKVKRGFLNFGISK